MVTIIKRGTPIEEIRKIIKSVASKSKTDIRKYAGTVKLNVDALEWQKKMRDEWD